MFARSLGVLLPGWSGSDGAHPAATFPGPPAASTHLVRLPFVWQVGSITAVHPDPPHCRIRRHSRT
ncbi:hypothetical protein PR001_g19480 [Phytophthora rubi]|uniref:Uncharacterized protein n=1 Tax=Phytophthora rubi TaxID=129364 RepID=A0A6A3JSM2_9STRA|nr:hypothetical protein PR001_g19480 [Phytophthora rubi]